MGINPKLHMKWAVENVLSGRRPSLAIAPPSGPETPDARHFHGGSDNMTILYSACWYAWGWLSRSRTLDRHRERCLNRMAEEALCHGLREPMTPSHLQLWLAAVALILWTAERDEGGEELLLAARKWFQVEFQTWVITDAGPKIGPHTPGARAYIQGKKSRMIGVNGARSMALKVLRDGFRKGRPDQYNVGPILLGMVSDESRRAIVKGVPQLPPMWGGCTLARWHDGDYVVSFGDGLKDKDAVRAGGKLNGELWLEPDGIGADRLREYGAKDRPVIQMTAPPGFPAGANKED